MRSLFHGARIVLETCMGVKRSETVLIITDHPKLKIAESLADVSREMGAETTLICMPLRTHHGGEPPDLVALAMRSFDVVVAPTTYSLTHTQARRRANESGVRIATMPMITEEMMQRGAILADYSEISRLTKRVAGLLDEASYVKVTTQAGTDLTLSVRGRKTQPDTGIFHNPGDFGNLPAGEAFIAPVEGTGNGQVIVDGSIVDRNMGKIKILFEKGLAGKISGSQAKRLVKILDEVGPKARNLAEFAVGTNPSAHLIGNVLEDEKVLGTCHIALGDNSTFGGKVKAGIHIDGIFKKPTVKLDGKILMKDGRLKV